MLLLFLTKSNPQCNRISCKVVGNGCICSVITGGTIVIGLKYGRIDKKEVIEEIDRKTKMFFEKFKEKFKSSCCRIINKRWKDNFISQKQKSFCAEIVKKMTQVLEGILK